MARILNFLRTKLFPSWEKAEPDHCAAKLSDFIEECDLCGDIGKEHEYAEIATVIAEGPLCEKIRDSLESEGWQELVGIQEFDGFKDALVVTVIRSGAHSEILVVLWQSVYELYWSDFFISKTVVEGDSARQLLGLIESTAWKPMVAA